MGRSYDHFAAEEREEIADLHKAGLSIRQIAAALDRSPSSISRELKRNSGVQVGYDPKFAERQAYARRWKGSRLERNAGLRDLVLGCLRCGWSPEQIAGRLKRDKAAVLISHESIYRFIAAQIKRTNDGAWRHYLPQAKSKRGRRRRISRSPASLIKGRVSIAARPPEVELRHTFGHWESDLMLFAAPSQAVLVAHERTSRLTLSAKQPSKAAQPAALRLSAWFRPLDRRLRKTITFDNGTEFAQHSILRNKLGIKTFFCDPHSPWQKGAVENAIGRLRRFLPRNTNLQTVDPKSLNARLAAYNNTPRKCLGFQTPAEVFFAQVLHFKRESGGFCEVAQTGGGMSAGRDLIEAGLN
jgi:transposase, IS30 family